MEYSESKLKSKVNAINKTNNYINKIVPKIKEVLKDDLKLKVNGQLNKKCSDKVDDILKDKPNGMTIYIDDYSMHHGLLKVKYSYEFEYFSSYEKEYTTNNGYIEEYIYLWSNEREWNESKGDFIIVSTKILDTFKPLKNKSLKSVLSTLNKIKKVDNKIELLNNKKSDIKKGFQQYIK